MNTLPAFATLDQNNMVINVSILDTIDDISTTDSIVGISSTDSIGISSSFSIITYNTPDSSLVNEPAIGYTLDTTLNAFIPPKPDPTYILNTITYQWEPNPSLTYDLHNDGKLYRYDSENICWIPTFGPEIVGVGTF